MYLVNLTFGQLLALFGAFGAIAAALYLLDRSRRKVTVSTLRFWVAAQHPGAVARRRRIQQPWSLLLQLLSLALLLLAIAGLRLGAPAGPGRNHVLILDASAWMAARSEGRTLMETAQLRARQYVRALPPRDRVMLVRADGLVTPATAFETDRAKVEAAIQASRPGATALNFDRALAFAQRVQSHASGGAGEIAYVGPGRTAERESPPEASNLRIIATPDTAENFGLRRIGMRRDETDPAVWQIYISAHNHGSRPRAATIALDFGPGAVGRVPAGARSITIPAGGDADVEMRYRAGAAGNLGVRLLPDDDFPADNYAELSVPAQPVLAVTVYSERPERLRPLLSSNPRINATYRRPSEYRRDDAGLVVLDAFIPPARPAADSVWIDPPAQGSPIPVRQTVERANVVRWHAEHPVAAGLRTTDFKLSRASVFALSPGDIAIGEAEAGPVIAVRPGTPKIVVLGFHPESSGTLYELATPLLFGNIQRWAMPEAFRQSEIAAASVGVASLDIDKNLVAGDVTVSGADGSPVPFTLRDGKLSFFAGSPGSIRASAKDRDYLYSLTLPQLWQSRWQPPAKVARGIPRPSRSTGVGRDLWPWLALASGAIALLEWLLFGYFRRAGRTSPLRLLKTAGRNSTRVAEVGR